jgi:hypothetical protein
LILTDLYENGLFGCPTPNRPFVFPAEKRCADQDD